MRRIPTLRIVSFSRRDLSDTRAPAPATVASISPSSIRRPGQGFGQSVSRRPITAASGFGPPVSSSSAALGFIAFSLPQASFEARLRLGRRNRGLQEVGPDRRRPSLRVSRRLDLRNLVAELLDENAGVLRIVDWDDDETHAAPAKRRFE